MSSSWMWLLWTVFTVSQMLVVAQLTSPGSSYDSQTGRQRSAGSATPGIPGQQGSGPIQGAGLGVAVGQGVGGSASTSGRAVAGDDKIDLGFGGQRVAAGSNSGPASYAGPRYGTPQVSRVDAVFHPTVTQLVTVDRFVTLTDQAFQSVAVTLTSLTVQTVATGTRGVLQTPVDDRVALQTTVLYKTSTLTVTDVQSDFRIVTERSLDYVTITHTSYIIVQTTYTTTATQVLSYTTTLVRTNINTKSTAFTDYRTITDTVLVPGGYYGFRQS
ncbi:uncharacterized protein [Procambarus clarkii]